MGYSQISPNLLYNSVSMSEKVSVAYDLILKKKFKFVSIAGYECISSEYH